MKISELFKITEKVIQDEHSDSKIYFDTEAVCFDVRFVEVASAYVQKESF